MGSEGRRARGDGQVEGAHLTGLVPQRGGQFCSASVRAGKGLREGSVSRRGPPPEAARGSWRAAAARRTSSTSCCRGLAASQEPRRDRCVP